MCEVCVCEVIVMWNYCMLSLCVCEVMVVWMCKEAGGGEGGEEGAWDTESKQEPHTKLWGMNIWHRSLWCMYNIIIYIYTWEHMVYR